MSICIFLGPFICSVLIKYFLRKNKNTSIFGEASSEQRVTLLLLPSNILPPTNALVFQGKAKLILAPNCISQPQYLSYSKYFTTCMTTRLLTHKICILEVFLLPFFLSWQVCKDMLLRVHMHVCETLAGEGELHNVTREWKRLVQ